VFKGRERTQTFGEEFTRDRKDFTQYFHKKYAQYFIGETVKKAKLGRAKKGAKE
jgi:hypothetical protein